MEFLYRPVLPSVDEKTASRVNDAAARLFGKLQRLQVDELPISDYNKSYIRTRTKNARRILQMYAYLLSLAMTPARRPVAEMVLCDYGGGSGLLSLLAKEAGVGHVLYNDIYDVSCRDARLVGESLGIPADAHLCGDIDDVLRYLKGSGTQLDAFVSCDVLEHIYDIAGFMGRLPHLSDGPLNVVMSSHANDRNPLIRAILKRKQRKLEREDRPMVWGHKERDSLRAYRKIREDIILNWASHLSPAEVRALAEATRGMVDADIRACVDDYRKTGNLPPGPGHPTNTCDPNTGNWAEHLMPPPYLTDLLGSQGFAAEILKGYYGTLNHPLVRAAARVMDLLNLLAGSEGIRFAPYFILYGQR